MKRVHTTENQDRFNGSLRHYHRAGAPAKRSWDDWVEGSAGKQKPGRNWLMIAGVTGAILALGGIIVGLVVELG